MACEELRIIRRPALEGARLVMAFTGWMDGGDAATGTIDHFVHRLGAETLAEIDAEPFSITNFPGSMEMASLFRPHVKIAGGLMEVYRGARNTFYFSEPQKLILFRGREPNFGWRAFADCVFQVVAEFGVEMIYFLGTFGGAVPHTREPRMYSSVSDESMKDEVASWGVRFSDYEGPGSFATYLTHLAGQRSLPLVSLVAEIPAYVQGRNPKCIEAVVRRLAGILGVETDAGELRAASDEFEERLNTIIRDRPELAEQIGKLETDYDSEVFDTQMGDLREWLEGQGIRLD